MFKFIFRFKQCLIVQSFLFLCLIGGEGCVYAGKWSPGEYDGYLILPADNDLSKDVRWANYLLEHLNRRNINNQCIITDQPSSKKLLCVTVALDTIASQDYRIQFNKRELILTARDEETMLWLQYQLIKQIGVFDNRIGVSDLPPAFLGFDCDTSGNLAFKYRGIYSPNNQNLDYRGIIATDDVEENWGIWGHQLNRLLKSPDTFASVQGKRLGGQYCFTSKVTFENIRDYITDNFGSGERTPMRFMIAPADNRQVCLCDDCALIGNTDENATPAVAQLIEKLATDFPLHEFFFLSYLTTEVPPLKPMPSNVGVMVSAINLPFIPQVESLSSSRSFIQTIDRWKLVTSNTYVWDYINNFDDYLTPFPILELVAERLRLFRSLDVTGVFFNGSGYDYCSFDDLRTYVFAALLINPDLNVSTLICKFYEDQYPISSTLLSDYVIDIEREPFNKRKNLPLYGGIQDAKRSYIDPSKFVLFHDQLNKSIASSKGAERKKLHELYVALCYTRLELARSQAVGKHGLGIVKGDVIYPNEKLDAWIKDLEEYKAFPDLNNITESGLTIASYLKAWRQLLRNMSLTSNLLRGVSIKTSSSDNNAEITDSSILTDGITGFSIGYHYGWYISSVDMVIEIPAETVLKSRRFKMNFLNIPHHRIYAPKHVEIYKDDILYKTFFSTQQASDSVCTIEGMVDLSSAVKITIKVPRTQGDKSQLASDEIYFTL